MYVTIDFETRSKADIRKVGSYKYAADPSTAVLCLAWSYSWSEDVFLWHPAFPEARPSLVSMEVLGRGGKMVRRRVVPPELVKYEHGLPEEGQGDLAQLFDFIRKGGEVHAHNAFFERCIWKLVCVARYGWTQVQDHQWRCTSALAASYALPRKLEAVAKVLRLPVQKSMEGNRTMLKLSKPAAPTKSNPEREWHNVTQDFLTTFAYCKQDVIVEKAVAVALRPLPPIELETWQLDQRMNEYGVRIDRALVARAVDMVAGEVDDANEELGMLTGGVVSSVAQIDELRIWLEAHGCPIPNLQMQTIDDWLADKGPPISDDCRRALELRRGASRASTKKYASILARICEDDRVRDLLRYHGASTGRWAGAGIQPQNFPRGDLPSLLGFSKEGLRAFIKRNGPLMEFFCTEVLNKSREDLRLLYDDPMVLLSWILRGVIIAPEGADLIAADYAAVEARGVLWMADQQDMLDVLTASDRGEGPKLYAVMAGDIYHVDPWSISKESAEYLVGKQAILGLGYQMGPPKFKDTCAGYGIHIALDAREALLDAGFEERVREADASSPKAAERKAAHAALAAKLIPNAITAEQVVATYRTKNYKVKQLWSDLERAAIEAVHRGPGGEPVRVARVMFAMRGRFLHCKLPSGRLLSYYNPTLRLEPAPWDETQRLARLFFEGENSQTRQWCEQKAYGGFLLENIVQATCRDLMRDAMLRLKDGGVYTPVLTVHDEIVAEVAEDAGDLAEFEALLTKTEPWAAGFPVAAEGWRGKRYRK
jgi:DNA polymerase